MPDARLDVPGQSHVMKGSRNMLQARIPPSSRDRVGSEARERLAFRNTLSRALA